MMLSILSCAFSAICMAQTTRVGLTLFCLPLTRCSALLQVSKAPCVSQLVSLLVRRLLWVWDPLLSSSSPSRGAGSISCPFFLSFIRPGCAGIFLVLLAIWGPLLVFSRCCENCFICIFLMWERWTPHLPLLLPWLYNSSVKFLNACTLWSSNLMSKNISYRSHEYIIPFM